MLAIDGAIVRADVTIYRRAFCEIGRISENQFSWIVIRNIEKFLALLCVYTLIYNSFITCP